MKSPSVKGKGMVKAAFRGWGGQQLDPQYTEELRVTSRKRDTVKSVYYGFRIREREENRLIEQHER